MERLIYTNAIGQQIAFDSTGTYRWTQVQGLGEINANFQVTASPYQDGATSVGDPYFSVRTIKIDLIVIASQLQDAIRELNSILNPKLGLATLTYERDGIKKVLNKVKTRVMPSLQTGQSKGAGFQVSSIIFEAFTPFYTDADFTEARVLTGANVFFFPLNIDDSYVFDYLNETGIAVTNSGDVDCPVSVVFDGPKSSPLAVENLTTKEKIVVALDLLENERLTITTGIDDTNVVKTDLLTGESSVAFQYIDVAETTFFNLIRGTNTLRITANEAAVEDAVIRFKNWYVGV